MKLFKLYIFSTPLPRGHHPLRFPRYRGSEILFQGRSPIRSSPPSESIGQPFNLCNQLIIILRVDIYFRAIREIRVLIKSTDCTDYTVFCVPIKFLNTNSTNLSIVFLSQQIAQITQLPSGWSCSPKVGELPVRVRGMSK